MTCMYLSIFEQVEKAEIEALQIAPELLYRAFEQVTDASLKENAIRCPCS